MLGRVELADSNITTLCQDVLTIKGMEVYYTAAGDEGTPVVLVHGGASDRRDWTKHISAFAETHRVYAPDLIGYGQSTRLDQPYTFQDFSDFLCDFMDALGIEKAFLVGHSLGGRACLEVAYRAPRYVEKLVLVAPMGFGKLSLPGMIMGAMFWAFLKVIHKRLPFPSLDIELDDRNIERFREVAAPTLILWGRWDPFFPSKQSRRALNAIPNARLKLLRSGHAPHKRNPPKFIKIVLDFFSEGHETESGQ